MAKFFRRQSSEPILNSWDFKVWDGSKKGETFIFPSSTGSFEDGIMRINPFPRLSLSFSEESLRTPCSSNSFGYKKITAIFSKRRKSIDSGDSSLLDSLQDVYYSKMIDGDSESFSTLKFAEGKGVIVAGNINHLLKWLLLRNRDPQYLEVFLLTYRTFIKPSEFLSQIIDCFSCDYKESQWNITASRRCLYVMRRWIEQFYEDFQNSFDINSSVESFINDLINGKPPSSQELGKAFKSLIESKVETATRTHSDPYSSKKSSSPSENVQRSRSSTSPSLMLTTARSPPMSANTLFPSQKKSALGSVFKLFSSNKSNIGSRSYEDLSEAVRLSSPKQQIKLSVNDNICEGSDILGMSPSNIAEQLILLETDLIKNVHPADLAAVSANGIHSKSITQVIDWFNQVSVWVAMEIVSTPNLKQRTAVLKRFITLAKHCHQLNSFNTLLEVLAGLNNAAVRRLKKTWKALGAKSNKDFEDMDALMENKNNYARYRQTLRITSTPCLPYFGVVLRDITMLDYGNPDYIEPSIINFEKLSLKSSIIFAFQAYQSTAIWPFKAIPIMQHFISTFTSSKNQANNLYKYSTLCEPPREA